MLTVFAWVNSLKYVITGVNYILRTVCIALINWIGYSTESMKLQQTTNVTFYVQFFNTSLILLLVNANLSEQFFSFGLNEGSLTDFNKVWFKLIGNTLVGTLVFTAYFPLLEAFGFWGLRLVGRIRDRGFSTDKYKTKTTSI